MCVNKDAARDSSQVLFELSKFKICYDQDKTATLFPRKQHKRI